MLNNSLNVFQSFDFLLVRILCSDLYTIFEFNCFGILMSSFLSSLHILGISPLSDVELVKNLLHSVGCYFCPMYGTGDHFLNITPITQTLRITTNKWHLLKLRSFCKAKDMANKTKRQPTEWEKIFINPTSDRELISKIYKELKKLDIKRTNNPIKMGYRPKQRTLNRGI